MSTENLKWNKRMKRSKPGKPSLHMSHESAQSPKGFQSSANNQVVHVESHPLWSDETTHIHNAAHNCKMKINSTTLSWQHPIFKLEAYFCPYNKGQI